jgi:Flp pilus assembly protein CpaB
MVATATTGGPAAAAATEGPVRLRRSRRNRFSGGHLAMLVAGLVGVLLTLALLRGADDRVRVAVAAHDLAAGAHLQASDVRYSPVAMSDELLATTLDRNAVRLAAGQVVVGPIRAGELITRGRLRPRAANGGRRAMSVAIDPARAVDGDLAPGDRVDVVVAGQTDVAIVVPGAEVLAVDKGDDASFASSASRQITVTLAVDARESQLLTAAIADGDLAITRVTGARSAVGTPPVPVEWVGAQP